MNAGRGLSWIIALAFAQPALAGQLALTDADGKSATLDIRSVSKTEVRFALDGRLGVIELARLSGGSRAEVLAHAKAEGIYEAFPQARIEFGVGSKRRNSNDVWYQKNVVLTPTLTIEASRQLDPMPPVQATAILVTRDTREKYVHRNEVLKVHSVEIIAIPASLDGRRRSFEFAPASLQFDAWRDNTNVGGDEYRYFVFGLRDPESGTLIDFQTNCPQLQKLVAASPEERNRFLSLKKGDKFPLQ